MVVVLFFFVSLFGFCLVARITAGKGKKWRALLFCLCEVFWLTKSVNAGFGLRKLCNFLGAMWLFRSLFIVYHFFGMLFIYLLLL